MVQPQELEHKCAITTSVLLMENGASGVLVIHVMEYNGEAGNYDGSNN